MKNILKFIALVLLIIFSAAVFFFGIPLSNIIGIYDINPLADMLNYGLDLTGGVYVVLEAKETEDIKVDDETMSNVIETIRNRVDSIGVKEPTITKQGSNRIRVSIPDIEDQEEAISLIGQTAKLEFVSPEGEKLLDGSHIKNAKYESQQSNSYGVEEPVVALEFTDEGKDLFAGATKKYINQSISIELDGEVISAPVVQAEITNGQAVISGLADKDEAMNLAMLIKAGALPVDLEIVEVRSVGPTLGENSLNQSLAAGAVGIVLVFIFMLVFYRFPGFIADVSLSIFLIIYLSIMALLRVTLTLPGIAGVILSVGMAVDANVIIFERIKEELYNGRSKLAAVDAGFSNAFSSIIDSNITTIIAGIVLYSLGSGTIKGFAVTLIIGICVSMFTAVFVTKRVMKMLIKTGKFENSKLYGVGGNK